MADIDAMIENLQDGFTPLTARALAELIEAFPEFFRMLADQLHTLSDYVAEQSPGLAETAVRIEEMSGATGAARDCAEQAALGWAEDSRFWFSDDAG